MGILYPLKGIIYLNAWAIVYYIGQALPQPQFGNDNSSHAFHVSNIHSLFLGTNGANEEQMVSFIIVNYNTSALVHECAASIRRYCTAEPFEIVVVDNASRPEEQERLKDLAADDCHLVMSRFNAGFGLGNMLGANVAKGDYLCFINSDAFLVEDCIHPLCEYLREHADVGCVTPQQVNGEGKPVYSHNHRDCIGNIFFSRNLYDTICGKNYPRRDDFSHTVPFFVQDINGCFMLFPTKTFFEIGGFDTNIFLYREEYDVGCRLRNAGYKCVVHPQYKFVHLRGSSTGDSHKQTSCETQMGKIYVYSKHHGLLLSLLYKYLLILTHTLPDPKRWYQLPILLSPSPMSKSMRHKKR